MYVDMTALDEECTRLACLMADRSMEHLTVPEACSPEEQGASLEADFSSELEKSFARIATAGSDPECIRRACRWGLVSSATEDDRIRLHEVQWRS